MRVTVGVHSCQRSTSAITVQMRSLDPLIVTVDSYAGISDLNARVQPPPRSEATKEPPTTRAAAGCKAWLGGTLTPCVEPGSTAQRPAVTRRSQPAAARQTTGKVHEE